MSSTPEKRIRPSGAADLVELTRRAKALRRLMLREASGKGEGYIAQGLGIADLLAVLYFRELRYDSKQPGWPARDRFLLSTGHYSIALYAALAEAGFISADELDSYGLNGSRLPMSTFDDLPGVEIVGGSLGQGLGQGVGMALGLRLDRSDAQVFVELSDGELQEGSTWESAMAGYNFKLDNLTALIDCNGIQADGKVHQDMEPVAAKWQAFGWDTQDIDGNDLAALTGALDHARQVRGRPKAIVLRTTPGKGIPTLERRERAHFIRIEDEEWNALKDELEMNHE